MKKWIILVVCCALCAATLSYLKVNTTSEKRIIYIRGAEPVIADSVTRTELFVVYESGGKSGMFMNEDVTTVSSIEVDTQTTVVSLVDQHKRRLLSGLGLNAQLITIFDSRLLLFFLLFAAGAIAMPIVGTINTRLRQWARRSAKKRVRRADDQKGLLIENDMEASDLRNIAVFFLELFKLQKGLTKEASARFSLTSDSAGQKMKRFELGVKKGEDWQTRRMSIGPLGEDTGSKSKCFYVIYDTHMVVKIPPVPIDDMGKYIRAIKREVQLATQMAPVSCIIPMVSVVLNKVKSLPYADDSNPEQLEKQYIRLVEENPEYEQYLKIGDHFALFMELTNSFFLGWVIKELHATKNKVGDEFKESPDVPWDQDAFTARYGLDALPVFDELQTLYQLCEKKAKRIIMDSGRREPLHTFQIKNWFVDCLFGGKPHADERDISPDLLESIIDAFSRTFKANQNYVDHLNQLLKAQLVKKSFVQNRQQIENISSNLLQLLDQLKTKRIALRDLKPDNLFLDANPDEYPVFLTKVDAFAIGVIDVETAISLVPDSNGGVAQPLLGGTPLYATPLHVLKNHTIAKNFGDVELLLHLQDWHATIAIIFKAITGRNLFRRAARSFPEVLKSLKRGGSKSDPSEETVKRMSRIFWSAAAADIKANLTLFADELQQLNLSVPGTMVEPITAELEREVACLDTAVRRHVSFSPLFKSEKNKAFLLEASNETIVKQIEKWRNTQQLRDNYRKVAPQMISFLSNLKRLKWGATDKRRAIENLNELSQKTTAYVLMESMFQITFRAMYKARWKALPKSEETTAREAAVEEDHSMVTTVLNEN